MSNKLAIALLAFSCLWKIAVVLTLSAVGWFLYDYDLAACALSIMIGTVLTGELAVVPVGRFGIGYDCLSNGTFGFTNLIFIGV